MEDKLLLDLTIEEFQRVLAAVLDVSKPTDISTSVLKKVEDLAVQFSLMRDRVNQDSEFKPSSRDPIETFLDIIIPVLDTIDDLMEYSANSVREEERRVARIEQVIRELERACSEFSEPKAVAEIIRKLKREQVLNVAVDFNQVLVIVTRLVLASTITDEARIKSDVIRRTVADELRRLRAAVLKTTDDSWTARLSVLKSKLMKPYAKLGLMSLEVAPGNRVNDGEQRVVGVEEHDSIGIGRIIRCTRMGYKANDRILRYSDVIVSKGGQNEGRT